MNYNNDELLSLLAGEYALGALQGPVRLRFERLLEDLPAARGHLRDWEAYFATFADDLAPEQPPEQVWNRIASSLGFAGEPVAFEPIEEPPSSQPDSLTSESQAWWRDRRTWLGIAAGIVMALAVLAVTRPEPAPPGPTQLQEYIAMMESSEGDNLWLLRVMPEQSRMDLQALAVPLIPETNDYELWMLPDSGDAPVSLGLMPKSGKRLQALTADQLAVLEGASNLAVSLEPSGGSPTGSPTGPVLYVASIIQTQTPL